MKKISNISLIVIAAICIAAVASCSRKETKKDAIREFSANLVSKGPMGEFRGKIYVAKDMTRMELPEATIITRLDKNVVWILMPAKTYMEQPLGPEYSATLIDKVPGEKSRELVGEEDIGGEKTKKYKITYTDNGKDHAVYQWISEKWNVPIKTADVDGVWVYRYEDLKPGKQDMSLFELPEGYKKFSFPGK